MTRLPSGCFRLHARLKLVTRLGLLAFWRGALTCPGRLPVLRVVVRKWETDLLIEIKATTWLQLRKHMLAHGDWDCTYSEKHNVGWLHRVLVGQTDESVVDPPFVVGLGWPSNRKVPLEGFVFKRLCVDKYLLFRLDIPVLFHYSPHCERGSTSVANHYSFY